MRTLQRVLLFHVKAWDLNCTLHIQQRFTEQEMGPAVEELQQRIQKLEALNASLQIKLDEAVNEPQPAGLGAH